MKRRLFVALLFVFGLIWPIIGFGFESKADSPISNVNRYSFGTTTTGSLTQNGPDRVYYELTLNESGYIDIMAHAKVKWVYFYLYDANANEMYRANPNWNSTSEVITYDAGFYLTSGTYYFAIIRDGTDKDRYGNYDIKIDFTSSNETFKEPQGGNNNTYATANPVSVGNITYIGQLAFNDAADFYRFSIPDSGAVTFNATFNKLEYVYWKLYDENGVELLHRNPRWNNTSETTVVQEALHLTAGTYYISVSKDGSRSGTYSFSLPYTVAGESFKETNGGSNNSLAKACPLEPGKTYTGQIAINDDKDFYSFNVAGNSVVINVNANYHYGDVVVYDANGKELATEWLSRSWNDVKGIASLSKRMVLENGTYYLAVAKSNDMGTYTVSVSTLTQENCPHEYENKVIPSTYFTEGCTTHTCKWCGKSYSDKITAKNKLGTPALNKYSTYGLKKRMRVQWYSVYDASGYQVVYSTNKKFKGAKTINVSKNVRYKIVKKLKRNKSYYVRVRAYVKSGKNKAYSAWSAKKKVKVR